MKRLILIMSILLLPIITLSQVSNYTFSETAGTYTAITGGTQLVTTTGGVTSYDTDGSYFTLPVGSQFIFNGTTITSINMTADGSLYLNPATTTTGNGTTGSIVSAAGASGIICGMNMDLRSTALTSQVYERRWQDVGTEVVFQWQNAARYLQSSVERFSFQIRVTKSTGVVKVVYGNMTTIANSLTYVPTVGLRGSVNTDFNNRRLTGSAPDATPNWGAPNGTTAGTSNAHTVRFTSAGTCYPSSGLTFIWTPPVIPVCSGTPTPGNTIASSATVTAPSGNVNLSLQNTTTGTGVTYQWQLSTTSSTTGFSNISGATLSTYTPTVTTNTWFRCLVTCSGNVGTSTSTQITLSYCTPTATPLDDATGLTFVGFNTISNTTTGTSAYTDFTSQSTSLDQGGTYPLTVRVNTDGAFTANAKAWIDWNANLIFDVSEEYDLGSANNTVDGITTLSPLIVAVGSSQAAGNYRMRIRATYNVLPTACGNQNYSETEDYTIVVVVPPPCTGTPNPGNTLSSSLTTSPNGTVNLSLQNTTTGTGVTYVWESSPDNSTWTIFGSSSSTQTSPPITSTTWFRSTVTCSGNSGISTPIQITLDYCTYNITNNDPTGITSVIFGTISNTSVGGPSYTDFTSQSTTVAQGGTYQLNVNVNTDGNWTVNTKVWIDWNQNYEFEVGEEYSLGSAINTANGITSLSPLNITVPSGATLGETRMRIVSVESSDPAPLACGTQLYGEAEDYKLSIIPPTGLPVELLYFEGTKYPTFNLLKWSTASESNSDYFSIEVSTDALTWKKIGEKKAAGNSNTKIDYSYTHTFTYDGIHYYKLLQYDYDGVFKVYGPIGMDNTMKKANLLRTTNLIGQEIDDNYKGFVIEIYDDGKVIKTIR
jgi:hypothetical protein